MRKRCGRHCIGLEDLRLAGRARGADGRVAKFEHWLGEAFNLSRAETALLCVLLLRGPQTPGELRGRTERLHRFEEIGEALAGLQKLMEREPPLAAVLARQPGTKESRYAHLLSGQAELLPIAAAETALAHREAVREEDCKSGLQNWKLPWENSGRRWPRCGKRSTLGLGTESGRGTVMNRCLMGEAARFLLLFAAAASIGSCGGSANKSATPEPSPPASAGGDTLPWVYSQVFSGASAFHTTVAALKANGATALPQSAMTSLWSQSVASQDLSIASYMFPVYVASATDPVKTFTCANQFAACDANNLQIHIPSGAVPEPQADAHIAVLDTTQNLEVDGWACTVSASTVACQWGGKHAFGGTGLEDVGSTSVKAGYAAGLFAITAQELLNGHIDHALGVNTNCLNNPTVYPADQNASGTDQSCGVSGPPSYGDMIHLL